MKKTILSLGCAALSIFAANYSSGQNASSSTSIPYTLEDRDRAVRMEEKQNSLEKRIDSMDKKMDTQIAEIRADMKWQFGMLISSMFILVGFILWDRRTAIKPLEARVKLIEQMQDDQIKTLANNQSKLKSLIEVLQNLGKEDPKLANVLKQFNLL